MDYGLCWGFLPLINCFLALFLDTFTRYAYFVYYLLNYLKNKTRLMGNEDLFFLCFYSGLLIDH